jgi:hypothetical protein
MRAGQQQPEEADNRLAGWVYSSKVPCNAVAHPAFAHFAQYLNAAYKPPSADLNGGTLLDQRYAAVRARVEAAIKTCPWVSLVADGWYMPEDLRGLLRVLTHG